MGVWLANYLNVLFFYNQKNKRKESEILKNGIIHSVQYEVISKKEKK